MLQHEVRNNCERKQRDSAARQDCQGGLQKTDRDGSTSVCGNGAPATRKSEAEIFAEQKPWKRGQGSYARYGTIEYCFYHCDIGQPHKCGRFEK